jgi:hypothetical protein
MNRLSTDELRFFKREGYLIKRGVMDPELTARARKRLWDGAPPRLKRNTPDTWIGGAPGGGFSWKFREPGDEDWMIEMLATNATVWGWAEQFLGKGTLVQPDRIRGIYCRMPEGNHPEAPLTCHTDGHPFHLGVVGLIDHVPPNGGGFTVWPRSHRAFYQAYKQRYNSGERAENYDEQIEYFNGQPSVDCHGDPGDIVFWHHRTAHMARPNRSRQIRQAVLYDFRKLDLEETQYEPPHEDMWLDWSDKMQATDIEG